MVLVDDDGNPIKSVQVDDDGNLISAPTQTPTPTQPPWLSLDLASKRAGRGSTISPPPSMTQEYGRHLRTRLGEVATGAGELAGEAISGVGSMVGSSFSDAVSGRPIGITAAKGMAEGAVDLGKKFGKNWETRTQAAMDQLNLVKAENEARIARGEKPKGVTDPNFLEAMAQSAHTVVPESETEEAVPGSGGALVLTGEALGRKGLEAAMAAPPVKAISTIAGGGGSALKALPSRTLDATASIIRNNPLTRQYNLAKASQDLQKFEALNAASPLEALSPMEQGTRVGAANQQARIARVAEYNKRATPLNDLSTDIASLLDDDLKLAGETGIKIPPEIAKPLQKAQKAKAGLPPVAEGEILTNPVLESAMIDLKAVPFKAVKDLRSQVGEKLGRMPDGPHKALVQKWYKDLSASLDEAAEAGGMQGQWDNANAFYRQEVGWNHKNISRGKPSIGAQIDKLSPAFKETVSGETIPLGGKPQKMQTVLAPANPRLVEQAHAALVPQGNWVAKPLQESGQLAFDDLIEQAVAARFPKTTEGGIDLTRVAGAIQDNKIIGSDTWLAMLEKASPAARSRLAAMEQVGNAYARIGTAAPASAGESALVLAQKQLNSPSKWNLPGQYRVMRPQILKWAMERPAMVEILTQGMTGPIPSSRLSEIAARNVSNVVRLYGMDTSRQAAATQ